MVARLFARGLRQGQVANICGYSLLRIHQLEHDPAFQQLIAKYRQKVDAIFEEEVEGFVALATSNMIKAERQLADKLDQADEAEETLPTRDLISISRDAADRLGFGKRQTQVNVNVDFAAQLERAIARTSKVIEGPSLSTCRSNGDDAGTVSQLCEDSGAQVKGYAGSQSSLRPTSPKASVATPCPHAGPAEGAQSSRMSSPEPPQPQPLRRI